MSTTPDDDPPPGGLDRLFERFADSRVRGLLFCGLGGLAVMFAGLFLRGSDLGGALIAVLGLVGLLFGYRGPPALILLLLLYFLVFPFGVPPAYEHYRPLGELSFDPEDLLLTLATLVYLSAHFRLLGITTRALPDDGRGWGKKEQPRKRPVELIGRREVPKLIGAAAAVVVVGQVVWAVVATVAIDTMAPFPFYFPDNPDPLRPDTGDVAPWRTRLVALAGLLFFGTLLARGVFGYWRLRLLTPHEGALVLTDGGWDETRRERVRVEGWRMWGVTRLAARLRAGRRPGKGKPR